jgi:hypothetical protein
MAPAIYAGAVTRRNSNAPFSAQRSFSFPCQVHRKKTWARVIE